MEKLQAELMKTHNVKSTLTWPSILEHKECSHGKSACMTPGCTNCCDELLYIWMYDLSPMICKECWHKFYEDNLQPIV